MKKAFLLIIMSLVVTACPYYEPYEHNEKGEYTPVYMSRETLEHSVMYISGARNMIQTGKIYYRAPYIFVNERYKGVHVINNSNPALPVKEGFILAPGCIDMAVKENILYLDNAVDLVSFDLDSKQVTKRIRSVFPEPLPPEDFSFYRLPNRPKGYILVEWVKNSKQQRIKP
jgi:hypothetical protein